MKVAMLMRDDPATNFNGISTFAREITPLLRKEHEVEWVIGGTDFNTIELGGKITGCDLVHVLSLPYGANVKLPMLAKCNSPVKEEMKYYGFWKRAKAVYAVRCEEKTLERAKLVVSVSKFTHDLLDQDYGAESIVIQDAVDSERFHPEPKDGSTFTVVKRRERGFVQTRLSQEEYADKLNRATYFVSDSLSEGFDLSLLEAMASGCICKVKDIPAHRELEPHTRENALNFTWEKTAAATSKAYEEALK